MLRSDIGSRASAAWAEGFGFLVWSQLVRVMSKHINVG